jgi:hypothetical protein
MPAKAEVDMLFKSKAPEKAKNAAANAAEVTERMVQQQQHSVVEQVAASPPVPKAGAGSCIGSGMSIVGNIECKGQAQVFGRIEGELRASDLLISDGAQVEGNVIAQNVTVCGRVKGTIRLSASSWRTVVRWRVTFFIGRCRSTRTLSLKDRRGGLRIQRTYRRTSTPKAHKKKTCRARPWLRICSALKDRHPLSAPNRRLS